MKSTISDIRYLLKVDSIAEAGVEATELAAGELGIFGTDSPLSLAPAAYADLPKEVNLVLNTGKGFIMTPYVINKANIRNQMAKAPTAAQPEIWEATIDHCDCVNGFELRIGIDETSLLDRDGFTWSHKDNYYGMTSDEIDCYCKDGEFVSTEDNNKITAMLAAKVNAANSPYYYAEVVDSADAVVEDPSTLDGSANVKLRIVGKNIPSGDYGPIETDYTHLRGVRLHPIVALNQGTTVQFEKTQSLAYEVGSGYDLRAEEWDNMNTYTTLNYQTVMSDGLPSKNIKYQFDSDASYHTFTMEYDRNKQDIAGEGDRNTVLVLFASETEATIDDIEAIFTPA